MVVTVGYAVMRPLCAGVALVDEHGAGQAKTMLAQFEAYLENQASSDEELFDRVREGVVVLLGTLARHMDPQDAKVRAAPHPGSRPHPKCTE